MVELVTTLGGLHHSWALRFVALFIRGRHRDSRAAPRFKSKNLSFSIWILSGVNIMSVHPCSGLSDNVAAFNVVLTLV